jgi:hypothetical protein
MWRGSFLLLGCARGSKVATLSMQLIAYGSFSHSKERLGVGDSVYYTSDVVVLRRNPKSPFTGNHQGLNVWILGLKANAK